MDEGSHKNEEHSRNANWVDMYLEVVSSQLSCEFPLSTKDLSFLQTEAKKEISRKQLLLSCSCWHCVKSVKYKITKSSIKIFII